MPWINNYHLELGFIIVLFFTLPWSAQLAYLINVRTPQTKAVFMPKDSWTNRLDRKIVPKVWSSDVNFKAAASVARLNPAKKIHNGRTNKISLSTRYNSSPRSFFPIYRMKGIRWRSDSFHCVIEIFEAELEMDASKKLFVPFSHHTVCLFRKFLRLLVWKRS